MDRFTLRAGSVDPWNHAAWMGEEAMNVFEQVGELEVILGRGSITAYEVDHLKPGDLVTATDRMCGEPVYLTFNSRLLGTGEIVVVDGVLMLRVTELRWNLPPIPAAGHSDDLGETLQFDIRIARLPVSLAELRGVGTYSMINLGTPHTPDTQADLVTNGITVARGIVHFSGESWTVLVQSVEHEHTDAFEIHTSGSLDMVMKHRPYDFTRPDSFSRDQIHTVAKIHHRFASNLHEWSEDLGDCKLSLVDQMTLGEYLAKEGGGMSYLAVDSAGPEPRRGGRDEGKVYFVQPRGAEKRVSDKTAERLAALGAEYDMAPPLRSFFLCYRPEGKLGSLASEATMNTAVLPLLRNAWKQRLRLGPLTGNVVSRTDLEAHVPAREMILLASIDLGDPDDTVRIVYPSIYFGKVYKLLG